MVELPGVDPKMIAIISNRHLPRIPVRYWRMKSNTEALRNRSLPDRWGCLTRLWTKSWTGIVRSRKRRLCCSRRFWELMRSRFWRFRLNIIWGVSAKTRPLWTGCRNCVKLPPRFDSGGKFGQSVFFRFCIPPSVNHRIMYSGGKQRPYRRMENPFVCFSVCFWFR